MAVENETPTSPLTTTEWVKLEARDYRGVSLPPKTINHLTGSTSDKFITSEEQAQLISLVGEWTIGGDGPKLTTRYKNAWFKVFGSDPPLRRMDNLATWVEQLTPQPVWAKLEPVLSYPAGHYGDLSTSCYFTYHKAARAILTMAGAYALLLRKVAPTGGLSSQGIGRSWVFPVERGIVLRNSYGILADKQVSVLTTLLGTGTLIPYKDDIHVQVELDDRRYQRAYVNGGSTRFIRIGEGGNDEPPKRVSVGDQPCSCLLYWHYAQKGGKSCEHCPFTDTKGNASPWLHEKRDTIESPGFERYRHSEDDDDLE